MQQTSPIEDKLTHLITQYPLQAAQCSLVVVLTVSLVLHMLQTVPKAYLAKLRWQSALAAIGIAIADICPVLSNLSTYDHTDKLSFVVAVQKAISGLVASQPSLAISHCLLGMLFLGQSPNIDTALIAYVIPYLMIVLTVIGALGWPEMTRDLISSWKLFDVLPVGRDELKDTKTENLEQTPPTEAVPKKKSKKVKTVKKAKHTVLLQAMRSAPLHSLYILCDMLMELGELVVLAEIFDTLSGLTWSQKFWRIVLVAVFWKRQLPGLKSKDTAAPQLKDAEDVL